MSYTAMWRHIIINGGRPEHGHCSVSFLPSTCYDYTPQKRVSHEKDKVWIINVVKEAKVADYSHGHVYVRASKMAGLGSLPMQIAPGTIKSREFGSRPTGRWACDSLGPLICSFFGLCMHLVRTVYGGGLYTVSRYICGGVLVSKTRSFAQITVICLQLLWSIFQSKNTWENVCHFHLHRYTIYKQCFQCIEAECVVLYHI